MRHIRTPVSLIVRDDRGKVVVRWGEDGVLRSRSFGDAVDPDAWYDAIHFYMGQVINRDLPMILAKMREHMPDTEGIKFSFADVLFYPDWEDE